MKRNVLFSFIFLFSFTCLGQIDRIEIGDWYLHNLIVNSKNNINTTDFQGNTIITDFKLVDGTYCFYFWICDSTGGEINYNSENHSFTTSNTFATLGGCETYMDPDVFPDDIYEIQNKLTNFYLASGLYTYETEAETITAPKTLTITASNGDVAIYHQTLLSSSESQFGRNFKIYPNPVKNELFISSGNQIQTYNIQIIDILGKVKLSKNIYQSNAIDVENFSEGIYILRIGDNLGNVFTQKFIKL